MVTAYKLINGNSTWKRRGVVFGLGGGLLAPLAGSLLTIVSWFTHPAALRYLATALFVVTLPLLILGAHCLDLLDKDKTAEQKERG